MNNISFAVHAGEIVGIAGIEGNGQTELIEAVAGLEKPNNGEVVFENRRMDYFKSSTAPALQRLLATMALLFLAIDLGTVILTTVNPLHFATMLIKPFIYLALIIGLQRRNKLACYGVIALSVISLFSLIIPLILSIFSFGLGESVLMIIKAVLGIFSYGLWESLLLAIKVVLFAYAMILAMRSIKAFSSAEKNEYYGLTARQRKELGIAHIPEDRHKRGLLLNSDLAENSIFGVHYRPPVADGAGLINSAAVEKRVTEIIRNFDVRPPNPGLSAKSLSGGNQQKLIIGREFELNPKLLLVSQPTRGVDIGAIEFIHRKLIGLRDAGTAVLLVSAELEEVTALADRLLVIREGKIVGEVNPKETSIEEIGLMMTGGN